MGVSHDPTALAQDSRAQRSQSGRLRTFPRHLYGRNIMATRGSANHRPSTHALKQEPNSRHAATTTTTSRTPPARRMWCEASLAPHPDTHNMLERRVCNHTVPSLAFPNRSQRQASPIKAVLATPKRQRGGPTTLSRSWKRHRNGSHATPPCFRHRRTPTGIARPYALAMATKVGHAPSNCKRARRRAYSPSLHRTARLRNTTAQEGSQLAVPCLLDSTLGPGNIIALATTRLPEAQARPLHGPRM